jgi:hypothetical protein
LVYGQDAAIATAPIAFARRRTRVRSLFSPAYAALDRRLRYGRSAN